MNHDDKKHLEKKFNELNLKIDTLYELMNMPTKGIGKGVNETTPTPLWKQVLNQTEFYNGHGQMEISELTLNECLSLCNDLTSNIDDLEDIFYVILFPEGQGEGYTSGEIRQCKKSEHNNEDIMWLTIEKVIFKGE